MKVRKNEDGAGRDTIMCGLRAHAGSDIKQSRTTLLPHKVWAKWV